MPGPPPIPNERKRLLGNPGKRALPDRGDVQVLPQGDPAAMAEKAPEQLEAAGRDVWERLWGAAAQWISPDTDLNLLTRYCEDYDEMVALAAIVEEEGRMAYGSTGQRIVHPAWTALRAVRKDLTKMEQLMGLTPADRSRIGLGEVQKVSAIEQLLRKRNERANRQD